MQQVEIRIEGHLDRKWVDWLGGFAIIHTAQNQTLLTGSVQEQAAFYGLIAKHRNLGVKLMSVNYKGQPTGKNARKNATGCQL
jgi:hypothetical protein